MQTLIIEYSSNNKLAKELIMFIKKSGLFKIKTVKNSEIETITSKSNEELFNETTIKAFDEAEKKVLKKHKTVNSLMKDLKS